MNLHTTKRSPSIGISISDSPDLGPLGLSEGHVQDAMAEIAMELLSSGLSLAYGGDLRPNGFTETLVELLSRYQGHPRHSSPITVTDYLAWPVHIQMTMDELKTFLIAHDHVANLILLALDGARIDPEDRLNIPSHNPDQEEWTQGLTAMRNVMLSEIQARIILGGRVEEYKGSMPGIAEETYLSLKVSQPVYILGGFGGCARDIAESIGLIDRWEGSREDWFGRKQFCNFFPHDLNNGLSLEENRALAYTPHIMEAVRIVTRGLNHTISENYRSPQNIH